MYSDTDLTISEALQYLLYLVHIQIRIYVLHEWYQAQRLFKRQKLCRKHIFKHVSLFSIINICT